MVDVIKYAPMAMVHINAAVSKDTPQTGKDAKVNFPYPLAKRYCQERILSLSPVVSINSPCCDTVGHRELNIPAVKDFISCHFFIGSSSKFLL